jgi:hypothetical protein
MRQGAVSHALARSLASLILATHGGSWSVPPASAQAEPAYVNCWRLGVARFDDRRESAHTVAAAVVAWCRDQRVKAIMDIERGTAERIANIVADRFKADDVDAVSGFVLANRSR